MKDKFRKYYGRGNGESFAFELKKRDLDANWESSKLALLMVMKILRESMMGSYYAPPSSSIRCKLNHSPTDERSHSLLNIFTQF